MATRPGQTVSVAFHQELTSPVYDGFAHYPSGTFIDFAYGQGWQPRLT